MAEDRSFAYALADNIIGFDDDYESLGERAGAALRDDPMGVVRTVGGAMYDSARDFGGRFVRDPAGAIVDSMDALGLSYVEAGKRLAGGIGAYTDQGMSVEEARDAQLMDALTVSELLGGGIFANQLRKGIVPSVDVGDSGPADPSRREFLKKSAATAGVAAVAPDAVREIMDMLPGATRRVVGANPLGAAVSQISKLRKQADEMSEVAAGRGELPFGNRDEYRRATFAKYDEIADTRSAALDALDADTLANASDADLDTFVREFYDYNLSGYDSVNSSDFEHPAYDALVMEMQKRGLHKQTDRQGLDKYPYARAMVEDYGIKTRKDGEFPRPADIDEETANKRIADAFSWAAELRDAKLNAVRDNLPVTRVADYDNAVRDVKDVMLRLEGIQNMLKDPDVNPFDVIDEKMAAIDEAVPLLANNRGGVSLTNARTEAMITPSMENPGKFRISYIDRKSGEPMGDTENFESMEAAIRDAMGQGYLTLGRFEPQNFANGGGVGSLSREARDMFRGPRGLESLSRFADGGDVSSYREALIASESSGRTSAENPSGAVGLTQAMPDTLKDFKRDTGLEFTNEEFKNSRDLQTKFQDWYEQKTINYIMDQGLDRFIGQTIKGVPITMSAMLGMAHLGGDYGMRKFLETGGRYDPDDGYTKLSDYGRKFSNLSIVGQGDVGLKPSPEEILMSMPVEQEAEFTDPRSYSTVPRLRPEFMPTAPMLRPRLRPDAQEAVKTEVEEALIRRARPSMVEKYGLPGDMPAGIGSLNRVAKNMYS